MRKIYNWCFTFLLFMVFTTTGQAQTQAISTYAGIGIKYYIPENGAATSAQLSPGIKDIEKDAVGNLYFSDDWLNRVYKIDKITGEITLIAGSGTDGLGDGGPATATELSAPEGLDFDAEGNLYIADTYNHRIRKVDMTTGIITTVVGYGTPGGPYGGFNGDGQAATSTKLHDPRDVAVDAAGNLYIADKFNNRIRKVDAATGIVSTIVGTGVAGYNGAGLQGTQTQLNYPSDIELDENGNLYIVDNNKDIIRKYDPNTGLVSHLVGLSGNLNYPSGIKLDGLGNLYIADKFNESVKKYNLSSETLTTVAGDGNEGYSGDNGPAVNAQMNNPSCVALDAAGNVFIGDADNRRIRKVEAATGNIVNYAGNGVVAFSGDGGLATEAQINNPIDVTFDASGNMYIADHENHRIRKVEAGTGVITTVAGNGTAGYSGDGGAATSAQLNYPLGVVVDGSGNLYIADHENHRIRKVDASTGNISTIAGTGVAGYSGDGAAATSAQLQYPYGIALDNSDNLYIADFYNHRVRKVDASTGFITTVAGTGAAGFNQDGIAAASAQLNYPSDVAFDNYGNLYISDQSNGRIRKVDASTGLIATVAGSGSNPNDGVIATTAYLTSPSGVAVDAKGSLYISDYLRNTVRRVSAATGKIYTLAGTGGYAGYNGESQDSRDALLTQPYGLAFDASNNLYIADFGNHRIRRIEADNTAPSAYSVAFNESKIGATTNLVYFTITGAEPEARLNYVVTDENGSTLSDDLILSFETQELSIGGTKDLSEGTLTLSVTLTDRSDNEGEPVTATIEKDATAPSGFTIAFDQNQVDPSNNTNVSFTFTNAEVGAAYNYQVTSSGDGDVAAVTGNGTINASEQQVTGMDVSGLTDGTLTLKANLVDDVGNYSTILTATVGKVAKASQTITFDALPAKTYGENPFMLSATASSGLSVVYAVGVSEGSEPVVSLSGNQVTILRAGTVNILAGQAGNEDYEAAPPVSQTLTVNKAMLTVTADDQERMVSEPNPELTFTYSGFVNSEDASVLDVLPVAATTATAASAAGTYDITVSGAEDNNYAFTYVAGTLTVVSEQVLAAENASHAIISTYPVPLQQELTVELPADWTKAEVRLINSLGEVVMQKEIHSGEKLDVSELHEGVFVIQLQYNGQVKTLKVVK